MAETIARPTGVPADSDVDPVAPSTPAESGSDQRPAGDLVESDLLVEDVSIDGMCGVY